LSPLDNARLAALCGERDVNIKQIQEHLEVQISHRAELFYIEGEELTATRCKKILKQLYKHTKAAGTVNAETVHLALVGETMKGCAGPEIVIKVRKHQVRPQNDAQAYYLRQILDSDVCFGIGPAGTGKTYLAVACAAQALANNDVERIVLVRPAVEAGEKLGFLPGDIGQKVDPYLRPLYDALHEMLGFERVGKLIERGIIELAPLAYMRGRTLNESFILLDEAQNTTKEQMKMFLTRMGYGSKMVITGDVSQVDLPKHIMSGLVHSRKILSNVKGISFTQFTSEHVVRHSLVQRIVEAYESQTVDEEPVLRSVPSDE
jgi:phosphate starvation-inducible PhoH-like protein